MCKNKTVDRKYYWYCAHKYSSECKSVAISNLQRGSEDHLLLKYTAEHNHAPDPGKVDELTYRSSLKRDAVLSLDMPSQIIQRNVAKIPQTSSCAIPNKKASTQIVQRSRKNDTPKEPASLEQIEIPEHMQNVDGEKFFARQVKFGEDFILFFATRSNLLLLDRSNLWVMDGTFKTCPVLFYQMYTIHGFIGAETGRRRRIVPLVYAFLSKKHRAAMCTS